MAYRGLFGWRACQKIFQGETKVAENVPYPASIAEGYMSRRVSQATPDLAVQYAPISRA
jgi:hypothetical protein